VQWQQLQTVKAQIALPGFQVCKIQYIRAIEEPKGTGRDTRFLTKPDLTKNPKPLFVSYNILEGVYTTVHRPH